MGIFSNSASPLEIEIEKATSENNTTEKWSVIMDICDKIGNSQSNAKESLKIITKRLNHPDPHVVMQAITLLDACIKNCGKNYHLEVASRDFEQEFRRLVSKNQPAIANKLKLCLKKWAEGDFKSDPQLNLIPSLYNKMKQEGHDFTEQVPVKREIEKCDDPNVVSSQQEQDDIAKAIELSLKEKYTPSKSATSSSNAASSLYPSISNNTSSSNTATAAANSVPEPRKVRALYDFEAAEDNELTFKAGEIIMVLEESDPNWWRGNNQRGEGYFPANFVTADLSAEPEDLMKKETRKSSKNNSSSVEERKIDQQPVEINEEAIDRLLFLLHEADPEDPSQDSDEMLRLENFVNQMSPLIDNELERVDRKHAQLTQLSSDLIDTINLYHSLMRDADKAPMRMMSAYPNMHNPMYSHPSFRTGMPETPPQMAHMNADQMNASFPSMVHGGNMHSMNHNQMPSLPPEQMMQQYPQPPQLQQHPNGIPNGQHSMIPMQPPSGMFPNPQDIPLNGMPPQQTHPSMQGPFPQNPPNMGQNYSLSPMQPPSQPNRMVAPPNFPMNSNQMMQMNPSNPQQQQLTEMMSNMNMSSMSNITQQQAYPQPQQIQQVDAVAPQGLYHHQP